MFRTLLAVALSFALAHTARAVQIDDPAPELTLEALTNAPGGADTGWDALEDKTIVLEFWGTWCGPCLAAIPHLNDLRDALPEDEFVFISVTFEDVELIERFLKKSTMKSWVGHDTDRSTVKAYNVKSWPTTFVIRDGVVVDRTHPTRLDEEKLHAYAGGAVAEPIVDEPVIPSDAVVAAPGSEPILTVFLAESAPGGDRIGVSTSYTKIKGKGVSLNTIARWLWYGAKFYDIELGDRNERYDVHIETARSAKPSLDSLVAEALELKGAIERRSLDGYIARYGASGLLLSEGLFDKGSGISTNWGSDTISIDSASVTLSYFIVQLERAMRVPIDCDFGPDAERLFLIDVELPTDHDALREALAEQTGIALEPARIERDVAVIRSSRNE